jgi:ABC-type amino acid transport substrate-binding protein
MDGQMSDIIAKKYFPKATPISIPQIGHATDILLNVASHKADITVMEPSIVEAYMKANPSQLRRAQDKPFQVFPDCFAFEIHENELREMIDSAVVELHNQGVIEEIISKYSKDPKVFLRVVQPYR